MCRGFEHNKHLNKLKDGKKEADCINSCLYYSKLLKKQQNEGTKLYVRQLCAAKVNKNTEFSRIWKQSLLHLITEEEKIGFHVGIRKTSQMRWLKRVDTTELLRHLKQ
jgi:hypothetical protein